MDEPIGKRLKLELFTEHWTAPGETEPSRARAATRRLFHKLKVELEGVLGRRLVMDQMGAQTTYSIGKAGEPIHLHMDAVHEAYAFNGFDEYGQEATRRSIAWLLYLSDDDWDEPGGSGRGGCLRAYPRRDGVGKVGSHEGNRQVGWLERGKGSEAVFLDSWVVPGWMEGRTLADLRRELTEAHSDEGELWTALYSRAQPAYRLYCVGADGSREWLSAAHETPPRDSSFDYSAPVPTLRQMLPEALRDRFSSTICAAHPKHEQVHVAPRGGTLVVFDTAAVPHEVTEVVDGERLALFGFFAEERRIPDAWADPMGADSICGPWFHDGWAHLDDEVTIYQLQPGVQAERTAASRRTF